MKDSTSVYILNGRYKSKILFSASMDNDLDLGQHFMIDEKLLADMVQKAEISSEDVVLEVGSGKGALSEHIAKSSPKELICVEIDNRCEKPSFARFIQGNVLDHIADLQFNKLVANIPYHISEPLFSKLSLKRIEKIVCVVGKAFADKLVGDSIIGSVVRSVYDVTVDRVVSPEAFDPPPSVDSALIILTLKKQSPADIVLSHFHLHGASKIKNFLMKASVGTFSKNEVRERLEGFDALLQEKELYSLTTEDFLAMRDFIYNKLF